MSILDPNTDSNLIPLPSIDPRNESELVEGALNVASEVSGGKLSDRSKHGVLRALVEGLAFAGGELLWWINKLPRILVIQMLRLYGVERDYGSKARVELVFTLTASFTQPFSIPKGFEVTTTTLYASRPLVFRTIEDLTIFPGQIQGKVIAECTDIGVLGNVPAGNLTNFTTPMSFLREVSNPEPAYGGTDTESIDSVEDRTLTALRRRDILISEVDYIDEVEGLLGVGSRVVIIPLLGADKYSKRNGVVHCFGLNPDRSTPTASQSADVVNRLSSKKPLGTIVYFSPIELQSVDVRIIGQSITNVNVDVVSNNIFQSLNDYINPLSFPQQDALYLKDVEFVSRNNDGVRRINSVTLNGVGIDVILDNRYTLPFLRSLYIELFDPDGTQYVFGYGEGDPD